MASNRLTAEGYIKRSPVEIKQELVAKLKEKYTNFFEQPADIQNMILDTSIQGILEYENLCAEAINSYAPSFQNDFMFNQLAASLGLKQKSEYLAQVGLEFSGNYGDYIPEGTQVGNFTVQEGGIIPTSGSITLVALSDSEEIALANTLTEILTPIKDSITVTNPAASLPYVPKETFSQFKSRVQSLIRSARIVSSDYARARIEAIPGVIPRLVNFRELEYIQEINGDNVFIRGVECVCGGGNENEIAYVLFTSFLETQKLISQPSNNETARSKVVPVNYYNTSTSVSFTVPKLLELGLRIDMGLMNILIGATTLDMLLRPVLDEYINNKIVGEPLNELTIKDVIMDTLKNRQILTKDISELTITPIINGVDTAWNSQGYLSEVEFDCYLTLKEFQITLKGGEDN